MRLQWLHFAVSLVLSRTVGSVTVTYNSSILPAKLPVAFTLSRDLDGSCTVISLVETQKHRLLLDYQDVVVETRLFKDAHHDNVPPSVEQLQLIGYVPHNLWAKAQELCSSFISAQEALGEFSRMIHIDQHTFSTTRPVKSPDQELHPLVQSGPSENRVDLTFFSDGCM